MKLVFFTIVLFITSCYFAQENQIDAKGRKQGAWKKLFPNSKAVDYIGNFKDDVPQGQFIYYYLSGKVKAKVTYVLGTNVSYTSIYHDLPGDILLAEGKFVDKLKDSVWSYYGPTGRISSKETYALGKLNGQKIVYYISENVNDKSRKVAQVMNYKNDLLEGESVEYFDNGIVRSQMNYIDGLKSGIIITNNPNGKPMLKDNYYKGIKHGWCYAYDGEGMEVSKVYYKMGIRLEGKELEKYLQKAKSKGIQLK
jgi:antitoxin component YwqK of YwqJK toxin-antitoxin module